MKKLIFIVMMIAALGMLTACGGDGKESSGGNDPVNNVADDVNNAADDVADTVNNVSDSVNSDDGTGDDVFGEDFYASFSDDRPAMAPIVGKWYEQEADEARELEVFEDATFAVKNTDGATIKGDIYVGGSGTADDPYYYMFESYDSGLWEEFMWESNNTMNELRSKSTMAYFVRQSDGGSIDDGGAGDDYGYDDQGNSGEEEPPYGTYSVLPDNYLPYFYELMMDQICPDNATLSLMTEKLTRLHREYTEGSDDEALDTDSIGSTPDSYIGVYYKSNEDSYYSYDDQPLEGVDSWLVFFKGGTWAIYDGSFENIQDCGIIVPVQDKDWMFYSLNQNGDMVRFFEFDTGTMTGSYGSYTRVYELWNY